MSEDAEPHAGGRPPKYEPRFAAQAAKLCEYGATDQEVADFFEVDVRTVYRWKHDYDEFCQALKSGKTIADERVERSLYQRAVGYEQEEVKIFMPANAAEPVYAPFRAKVAPDITAAIFWLKNRKPDTWRDKQDVEHSGSVEVKTLGLDQFDTEERAVLRELIQRRSGQSGPGTEGAG